MEGRTVTVAALQFACSDDVNTNLATAERSLLTGHYDAMKTYLSGWGSPETASLQVDTVKGEGCVYLPPDPAFAGALEALGLLLLLLLQQHHNY